MRRITERTDRLAITMWDSSWIRRRYRGGGFEDWDRSLDELVDRGYNAVRIDCFPHLVAKAPDGTDQEVFNDPPGQPPQHYATASWGNQWTVSINPRESLVEFIRKCEERDVAIGLSTWFKPTDDRRNSTIEGAAELIRVWDETLGFLNDAGCLDNVVYVDLLNEYPFGHCMWWVYRVLDTMRQPEEPGRRINARQLAFEREFIDEALTGVREKWKGIPIAVSLTYRWLSGYEGDRDFSTFDFLDVHDWVSDNTDLTNAHPGAAHDETGTGTDAASAAPNELTYFNTICRHGDPDAMYSFTAEGHSGYGPRVRRVIPGDYYYAEVYAALRDRWQRGREAYRTWLEERIRDAASVARKWELPIGNTEGWGLVNWFEHPALEWEIQKGAAEIAIPAAAAEGYCFNCTSNMAEPQFLGLWEDLGWHREMTGMIRAERPGRGA